MGKADPSYLGRSKLEELQTKALSIQLGKFEGMILPKETKKANMQQYLGQKVITINQLMNKDPNYKFFHAWDAIGVMKHHTPQEFHKIPIMVKF